MPEHENKVIYPTKGCNSNHLSGSVSISTFVAKIKDYNSIIITVAYRN